MSQLIDAPDEVLIAGRATGKSEGVLAPKMVRIMNSMPRSTGVLVSSTFQQTLTRTLPGIVAGFEKEGYIQDVHYVVGVKPTEKWKKMWKWPGPYRPPVKSFEYFISWWNGAGIQLVSQDRIGSSNGISIDWVAGDEAKLLKEDRLKTELLPANRGVYLAFKDKPHHHGVTFTTDMPVGTAGRWLFDKEKEMDVDRVKKILQLQCKKQSLSSPVGRKAIDVMLNCLRLPPNKNTPPFLYYHEASTLDNIHGLGIDYFRKLMRDLSPFEFSTAILNRKPIKIEDGFYPDLDEEKHGYFAYDYGTFGKTGYEFKTLVESDDVRVDSDYNPDAPIHIVLDHNRRITPLVVGQLHKKFEMRAIRGIHSLYPLKLDDTLNSFCTYYKNHKHRIIHYWYDHTATAEYSHAGAQCDDVIRYLRKEGWVVVPHYVGLASGHERRYTMYSHFLREDGTYPFYLRINRDRCKFLLLSMFQTEAILTKNGFGKNKKSELNPKFPSEEAPHYGEALDIWAWGMLECGITVGDQEGNGSPMLWM